jgi:methylenetetrahydrofolate reductase (NADPH)
MLVNFLDEKFDEVTNIWSELDHREKISLFLQLSKIVLPKLSHDNINDEPNLEIDLKHLKNKVDEGAGYIMTQIFFDNQKFYDFVKACRDMGITVPIIPGLKPITNKKQLSVLPRIFHVDIPTDLSNAINKCKTDADCEQVGTEWLIQQSKELKAFGVPVLHYYTLGKPKVIYNAVKELV